MQLYKIRGGSKEDLQAKKYNIAVGVSLGNKWFTPEKISELAKWCVQYTRESVVVYPADEIHAINIEVRNGKSRESAVKIAKRMGSELLTKVKERIDNTFLDAELAKIRYATWSDVVNGEYTEKVRYLYDQYENNPMFKQAIHELVGEFVSHEKKKFSDEDIHRMGNYLIEELPEVTARVTIKNEAYDAYAYPFDSKVTEFIERLQNREVFPEIGENIIDTLPKVFLEVR